MHKLNIKNYTNKFLSLVRRLTDRVPLSARGFVALILSVVCFFYFGLKESDLVASIIAVCLFVSIFMAATILTITSRGIFRAFKEISHTGGEVTSAQRIFAKTETRIPLSIPNLKLAPLTSLSIKREFKNKDVQSKKITLHGLNTTGERFVFIFDEIKFPHRGLYSQAGLHIEYSDVLGLCKIKKFIPLSNSIEVYPQETQVQALPIMAASAQLGDIDHATVERTGDLFDIREYQAGDSLKRVLWKVYAKSGNLVVRQPEPAIIPEGEVAVFCFAKTLNDRTASAFLSYLKILDDQNIIYTTSCLGNLHNTAKTIPGTERLILESAELADKDVGTSFSSFVENIKKHNHSLNKIIGFFPKSFSDDWQASNQSALSQALRREINQAGISLVVALVDEKASSPIFDSKIETPNFLSRLDNNISKVKEKQIKSILNVASQFRGKATQAAEQSYIDTFRDQEVIEVGVVHA